MINCIISSFNTCFTTLSKPFCRTCFDHIKAASDCSACAHEIDIAALILHLSCGKSWDRRWVTCFQRQRRWGDLRRPCLFTTRMLCNRHNTPIASICLLDAQTWCGCSRFGFWEVKVLLTLNPNRKIWQILHLLLQEFLATCADWVQATTHLCSERLFCSHSVLIW